jgi:murein L,D-transpeptidase YafK
MEKIGENCHYRLLLLKSTRELSLYRENDFIKKYNVKLGKNPIGPKEVEGDFKTPEGEYLIDWRNPKSLYYLSLHINYPSAEDKIRAKQHGKKPGHSIMIHGEPNNYKDGESFESLYKTDWTEGCVALSNKEMKELYDLIEDGASIEIRP